MKVYKLYKISYNIDESDDVEVVNYYVDFDKAEEHFIVTCKYCDSKFNIENIRVFDNGDYEDYEYKVKSYQNNEYFDYVKLDVINVVE